MDQKEREEPGWKEVRKSFAPSFSMVAQVPTLLHPYSILKRCICNYLANKNKHVQVLKKRKVKEEGGHNLFVEQNHRPKIVLHGDRPPDPRGRLAGLFFSF